MKRKLSAKEYTYVASMLFGLFFGAGNLIFPVHLGQMAGSNVWLAILGLLITGVGLPLLGVAALGISRSAGLFDLSSKVSRPYAMFFTCALYLTIGPFFAIPRCATTSFTVGLEQVLPQDGNTTIYLLLFSVAFFAAALFFALRPGKILTWVGKILTPCFLVFLAILVVVVLATPGVSVAEVTPLGGYADQPFFTGFLEGYNTMDALASLAFGIIVVQVIRDLGVEEPSAVAGSTVRAGIFSCLFMALIYIAVTLAGTQSRGVLEASENGGTALAQIAQHYLGKAGLLVLAATVTLACLKTAVGLITSCAETFVGMFPKGLSYRNWVFVFTGISFLLANVGLTAIITYAVPVLMFLYPLAITLILLALLGHFFDHDRAVYAWVTGLTLVAAFYDLLRTLPDHLRAVLHVNGLVDTVGKALPFATIGLGWFSDSTDVSATGMQVSAKGDLEIRAERGGENIAVSQPSADMKHFGGEDVKELQRQLRTTYYYSGTIDGIFGAHTEDALRKFQLNLGLPSDGIAGAYTYAAIQNLHHSWVGKAAIHEIVHLGFARAADVLEQNALCLFGTEEFARSVASRMSNLSLATNPQSKILSADSLLVAPDESMLLVHIVLPEEEAVQKVPRVSYEDEATLPLRLEQAIVAARKATSRRIAIELPGRVWEDAGEGRSAQHFAITLLDALCTALSQSERSA